MFEKIYEKIKEFDNIVIVRHIGVDPDALCSQLALRDSIRLTFPNKKVLCLGSTSNKFDYLPKLDRYEVLDNVLLIVTDTPDKKRVDYSWELNVKYSIKIDHHPHMETFCDLEYIDDFASLNVFCMTLHLDIKNDLLKVIERVKSYGIKVGIALNPDQDINLLLPYLI